MALASGRASPLCQGVPFHTLPRPCLALRCTTLPCPCGALLLFTCHAFRSLGLPWHPLLIHCDVDSESASQRLCMCIQAQRPWQLRCGILVHAQHLSLHISLTLEGVRQPACSLKRLPLHASNLSSTWAGHSDLGVRAHPVHPVLQECHSISAGSLTWTMLHIM